MPGWYDSTYTLVESTTRTDEETSSDTTTNCDHVQVAGLHGAIELDEAMAVVLALEGLGVETVAGHEGLVVVRVVQVVEAHGGLAVSPGDTRDARDLVDAFLAAGIVGRDGVLGGHVDSWLRERLEAVDLSYRGLVAS